MAKKPSYEDLEAQIASLNKTIQHYRHAESRMRENSSFRAAVIEHAAEGICVCHEVEDYPYVRFNVWNERMTDLTGYTMDEINLAGWYQTVYPDPKVRARAAERMARMREGIDLRAEEWSITRKDGKQRIVNISTSILETGDGRIHVLAILNDITERKHNEVLLQQAHADLEQQVIERTVDLVEVNKALEQEIRERQKTVASLKEAYQIIERSPAAAFLWLNGEGWPVEFVTENVAGIFGYTADEFMSGRIDYAGVVHPDDLKRVAEEVSKYSAEEGCEEFTHAPYRIVTKDGSIRWIDDRTSIRRDTSGRITHYQGIIEDVTDRIIAEELLRESKERYRAIVETFEGLIYICSRDYTVEFMNQRLIERTGYDGTGKKCYEVLHGLHSVCDWCVNDRVFNDEIIRWEVKSPKDDRWYYIVNAPIHHSNGTMSKQAMIMDITGRKQSEQALRESEEKFAKAFHQSPDAITLTRLEDGKMIETNEGFTRLTGYRRAEVIDRTTFELDLWAEISDRERYVTTLHKKGRVRDQEFRFRMKSGQIRHGLVSGEVVQLGPDTCILGTIRDITERKKAERALSAEKERLAVTLRSIGDGVITTDREGLVTLINPIAEALTGWNEADAVGKPLLEVFHIVDELNRQPCDSPVDKVIASGQVVGLSNHTVLISKNGREAIIADSGAPIFNAENQIIGVVLVFRDVTDTLRMENELMKVEKLNSLGVLAGGIAHDFNNFLTGIIGNLSLVKLDVGSRDPIFSRLEEMEKAALRAKDLTQQLLTFSKGGQPIKRPTNLIELVKEAAGFALRGSNVRCRFTFAPDTLPAEVDESQIAQVIHNLILNAEQAMPEGGVIDIQGELIAFDSHNVLALETGEYVKLTIQDCGTGIKKDHLKKVFDPYFTTKQKGSGLGLAVVYSIVDKHNGRITVASQLGAGTTVSIYLPAVEGVDTKPEIGRWRIDTGGGRILVMDDEAFIRDLASKMLQKLGYTATVAANGREAIRLYQQAFDAGEPFDAVILDLTVPGGLGGKEVADKLVKIDKNVKAIVSSGYSNDPVMSNYGQYGFQTAVKKPYQIQEMAEALRSVIQKSS